MDRKLTTIGFDADDTLWHHEKYYHLTQTRFAQLLADFTDPETLEARLLEAERRNLGHYGFGVKGFVLSMIETAIEVTEARVHASVIATIMEAGRDMLRHPIELLKDVRETITVLSAEYNVVLITKGDLLDQERKLAQSGLGDLFDGVEILSHKTPEAYANIFARYGRGASRGLMVGNSMASDVLPMIAAGGWGVHVPSGFDWALEAAADPDHARFVRLDALGDLPELVARLAAPD